MWVDNPEDERRSYAFVRVKGTIEPDSKWRVTLGDDEHDRWLETKMPVLYSGSTESLSDAKSVVEARMRDAGRHPAFVAVLTERVEWLTSLYLRGLEFGLRQAERFLELRLVRRSETALTQAGDDSFSKTLDKLNVINPSVAREWAVKYEAVNMRAREIAESEHRRQKTEDPSRLRAIRVYDPKKRSPVSGPSTTFGRGTSSVHEARAPDSVDSDVEARIWAARILLGAPVWHSDLYRNSETGSYFVRYEVDSSD